MFDQEIRQKMLSMVPEQYRKNLEWYENQRCITVDFVSKRGKLICTLYDRWENKFSQFSVV